MFHFIKLKINHVSLHQMQTKLIHEGLFLSFFKFQIPVYLEIQTNWRKFDFLFKFPKHLSIHYNFIHTFVL